MNIRQLVEGETPPFNLLLLADPSRELVEEYLENGECRVAEVEGEVVGVYVLVELNVETMEIMNVAVDERMQGRGIGKKLIRDAIQTVKGLGYKSIEIGTGNSSVGQLALYKKCGFGVTGLIKDFFVHNYEEAIFENGIQCRDMIRLSMEV
ncbi:GNAT family N-acetyltransferase [Sporosarcina limicola]|uniref:Ribosomal protein S18 acetylase RimI-like enzyme n=1 Tax=Sporosarcina limicola TaxID=34101 RepID=A0A927RB55_9BACL|nr:GNAT family N-acetyltransferase [Sporosarcina limicola]MBE1553035.1 ribosomal protein S18 acetylase RimI-like enzyme [Sporosarcina limicola]